MYLRFQIENFRLFAALRLSRERPRGPIVLVDAAGRVAELNQAAQTRDLSPGMTMARAMSRCGDIFVLHADPSAERAAKRLLWNVAWELTPQIELGEGSSEGAATLEMVRPDLDSLQVKVDASLKELRRLGLPARAGFAATPEWAGFAADTAERFGLKILQSRERVQSLLEYLPLGALDCLSEAACRILEGWGIRSLAAVAKLPRQDLGERLGPVGLQAWDILNGASQPVLQVRNLTPDYQERFDLEEPLLDLPALCFILQRAAEALECQLEQAGKMARALSLDLWLEGGRAHRKTIRLPEATRRADLMTRLLGNALEQITLTAAVVKGRVSVDPVDPLSRQAGLFERSVRNPWRLQETLDQLASLLGSESFGVAVLRDSHQPDAYQLMPLPSEPKPLELGSKECQKGPPRMGPPMRRFRPPLSARVLVEKGHPAHVTSSLFEAAVCASHGPYSVNGDWATAKPWAYFEWDVELKASGVFCLRRSGENWQLIGAYD